MQCSLSLSRAVARVFSKALLGGVTVCVGGGTHMQQALRILIERLAQLGILHQKAQSLNVEPFLHRHLTP